MATRSLIGKLNSDNTVDYIYCHWDGYVDNNGRILYEHYNTLEKVDALLALGDLSSLGNEIGEKHDFDFHFGKPGEDWCTAYGRDRGETGVSWKTTTFEMYPKADNATEYQYLFTDEGWKVNGGGDWELVVNILSEIN
jgi:hypothetical protein